MKPTPKGWPRISTALSYEDPAKAIDWLCNAFGFEVQLKVEGEGGEVVHSELLYGEGLIMVGSAKPSTPWRKSPKAVDGANTQSLMLYVDDAQAHHDHAKAQGAKIVTEPKVTDYGEDYWADKGYEAEDLDGHHWWFMERLRSPKPKS